MGPLCANARSCPRPSYLGLTWDLKIETNVCPASMFEKGNVTKMTDYRCWQIIKPRDEVIMPDLMTHGSEQTATDD